MFCEQTLFRTALVQIARITPQDPLTRPSNFFAGSRGLIPEHRIHAIQIAFNDEASRKLLAIFGILNAKRIILSLKNATTQRSRKRTQGVKFYPN